MSEFLDLGVVKKQKISQDLKSRKKFLAAIQNTILKFNSEFKKNKDKSFCMIQLKEKTNYENF